MNEPLPFISNSHMTGNTLASHIKRPSSGLFLGNRNVLLDAAGHIPVFTLGIRVMAHVSFQPLNQYTEDMNSKIDFKVTKLFWIYTIVAKIRYTSFAWDNV